MDRKYKTILNHGEDEIIINKSRFIGQAMPISSEEEALEFIDKVKAEHREATHNVYAYVVGEKSNVQRFSDDGEPSGTAGIPALEVIKKEELRDVVVVVTRYFGGIHLGAGGLIRAYTKGCKIGLDASKIVNMILHKNIEVKIDYTLYGKIENYLQREKYIIDKADFAEDVNLNIYVDIEKVDKFKKDIMDMTSGTGKIADLDEKYIPFEIG